MSAETDYRLLELAAKAAGADWLAEEDGRFEILSEIGGVSGYWNPLNDDGDALRLAVALDMSVDIDAHEESTYVYAGDIPRIYAMEMWHGSKQDATRLSIVRLAAEIGRMKP